MGYLSGMNMVWDGEKKLPHDPLAKLNSDDQAYVWMDNFCQKNPLKNLSEGAVILFFELAVPRK